MVKITTSQLDRIMTFCRRGYHWVHGTQRRSEWRKPFLCHDVNSDSSTHVDRRCDRSAPASVRRALYFKSRRASGAPRGAIPAVPGCPCLGASYTSHMLRVASLEPSVSLLERSSSSLPAALRASFISPTFSPSMSVAALRCALQVAATWRTSTNTASGSGWPALTLRGLEAP